MFIVAVLIASAVWFLVAAILFFNPIVDKVYRSEEAHPAVKALPQTPGTIGKILLAILAQSLAWAFLYTQIAPAFGGGYVPKGLFFGVILILVKMVPRDIDRILLSTYPVKRMTIEFVIGVICSFVVGLVFAYFL
jgi:hypothetical protein